MIDEGRQVREDGVYEDDAGASALTIHGMPNRSMHMPNWGDQNVSASGMVTSPPSAKARNTRWASAMSPTA